MRHVVTVTALLLLLIGCQMDSEMPQMDPEVPEDLKIEKNREEIVITLDKDGGTYLLVLEGEKRGGKHFFVGRDCPQLKIAVGDFERIRAFPLRGAVGIVQKAALVWEPCDDSYCTNPPCPPGAQLVTE